ncbi:ubiquinol-cytochrome c reductase iron-sulfur subunit [Planctomycetota bacterium]
MSGNTITDRPEGESDAEQRRGFLAGISTAFMAGGLFAGYGTLACHAARFMFPNSQGTKAWQFVSTVDAMKLGQSLPFMTPAGAKIVVARQADGDDADSFIALSSVCPHLGCAVHWESQNSRFFCPCHNGAFDAAGKPTEGPPLAANQELTRFPLKVDGGLLYIEIPTESLGNTREA